MFLRSVPLLFSLLVIPFLPALVAAEENHPPLPIGSRLELFVDDFLIDRMVGVDLRLHSPRSAGKALSFDRPWEGTTSTFVTLFKDGERYRMYYRGASASKGVQRALLKPGETVLPDHPPVIASAESSDGIHWTRPSLGIFEFQGSKENNIVWMDRPGEQKITDCMYVFKDDRPSVPDSERYKALGGSSPPLIALVSPDGLHWKELQGQKSLISEGLHGNAFDSLSSAFWDHLGGHYVLFFRDMDRAGGPVGAAGQSAYNYGNRSFKYTTSPDFIHWSYPQWVDFGNVPAEHHYTPAATPYFRAPHIYLAFPMRLQDDWRTFHQDSPWPGVTDAVFMTSRDGIHWDRRFMEAFIRPGRDPRNWRDRSNMPAYGVIATSADEISLYVVRDYTFPSDHLERMVLRTDGFVSVHADYAGGEFVSKPLVFEGGNLVLNYSTSAAGSIRVEIQDGRGNPLPGFSLLESPLIFGDEIEHTVRWKRMHPDFSVYPEYAQGFRRSSERPLARLAGKTVRLRFVMKDADLYSIQFR